MDPVINQLSIKSLKSMLYTHYSQKLIWDFEVQTYGPLNLGQNTRPKNNQQKKKKKRNCKIVDFAVPAEHKIKLKECEKKDKYLDLARKLKKTMEHEGDNYTNCDWCFWYSQQRIIKRDERTWRLQDEWRPSKLQHYWEGPDYGEEYWRFEGDLWTLMWKTLKE